MNENCRGSTTISKEKETLAVNDRLGLNILSVINTSDFHQQEVNQYSPKCLKNFRPTLTVAENNAKNRSCNSLIINTRFSECRKMGAKKAKNGLQLMNIYLANVH
ncbi:MAG: hypothetical protein SPI30_09725 [Prevotella sp.]|nr:hypothetical protein [Prevotella sp.]